MSPSYKVAPPAYIRVDVSSKCQLKCPECPTANGLVAEKIGGSFLDVGNLERLLVRNPSVKYLEISNWGEVFLNPQLKDILRLAYDRGVSISCANGANFNAVSEAVMEALVTYKVRALTCSIDGASDETYRIYRRGGDFGNVIANIRKLNEIKQRHGSEYPELTWQFIAFGHNEHEIPIARKMAEELNMKFFVKLNWNQTYSPAQDSSPAEDWREDSALMDPHHSYVLSNCGGLWNKPQIHSDGKVLGCCVNYWSDFGNAFDADLMDILNGERMSYARAMLQGQKPARADIPCVSCSHYKAMLEEQKFLEVVQYKWRTKARWRVERSLSRSVADCLEEVTYVLTRGRNYLSRRLRSLLHRR